VAVGRHLSAGIIAACLSAVAQASPQAVGPVIHARDEDKYQAMKSAPVILLAEFTSATAVSGIRDVPKPLEVGGPMAPTIPMAWVQISARVLLTMRGPERSAVQFDSWMYAGGKHGGSRLFHPSPGSVHVVFLREDNGILHTVGDYPAYDLEFPTRWLPAFISQWKSGKSLDADLFERIAAVQLQAEFESIRAAEREYFSPGMQALMGLTSPFFVAGQLDTLCRQLANPSGRFAACYLSAQTFPGRCQAYRLAIKADLEGTQAYGLFKLLEYCEASAEEEISALRGSNWPLPDSESSWSITPERHRLAMRLYASAIDAEFHKAACEAAFSMPEARAIPECFAR
jgi:hypothetical protein